MAFKLIEERVGTRDGSLVITAVGGGNGGEGEMRRLPVAGRVVIGNAAFELSAEVIVTCASPL